MSVNVDVQTHRGIREAEVLNRFDPIRRTRSSILLAASVDAGRGNRLTAELFMSVSAAFITHFPCCGGGPAIQDLVGRQVESMLLSAVLAQPHVKAGKLKALAQPGARRAGLPEVPTVAESSYKGFGVNSGVGLLAPAERYER